MTTTNGTEPVGAPIKPTTITVAGTEYPLRYSFRTVLALEDLGLTPDDFWAEVNQWAPKIDPETKTIIQPGRVKASTVLKFVHACMPANGPTLDQLSEQVSPFDFKMLFEKAIEVITKTRPQAKTIPEPAANPDPERPVVQ